jgi:hypothetical protein
MIMSGAAIQSQILAERERASLGTGSGGLLVTREEEEERFAQSESCGALYGHKQRAPRGLAWHWWHGGVNGDCDAEKKTPKPN